MLHSTSTLLALALLASLSLSNAQMVSEIGDGQIQNQAPTAVPTIVQPASSSAPEAAATAPPPAASPPATTPSSTPYLIESSATLSPASDNATSLPSSAPMQIPASLAGPRVPLYSANTTMAAMATGTGGVGGNASAPTVPAVPTGAGMAPIGTGGPKEAGTSAPAVVGSGAEKGRVGAVVMVMAWVGWGVLVAMMG